MKIILEKRQRELEEEIKKKKREEKEKILSSQSDGASGEEEKIEDNADSASTKKQKFAFQDVSDESQDASEESKEIAAYRRLEEERQREREREREREEARELREKERDEARQKLQQVKEDIESSRHVSVPKFPLDIAGTIISESTEEGTCLRATIEFPTIDKTFSFAKEGEEEVLDFAVRVISELRNSRWPSIKESICQVSDGGQQVPAGASLDIMFVVQCLRTFHKILSWHPSPAESAFALRFNPAWIDPSLLEQSFQNCSSIVASVDKSKNSFLQASLEAMLSLDSDLESAIAEDLPAFKRLAFFPLFDFLFLSVDQNREATAFLKARTKDILRTILGLESDVGFSEYQSMTRLFEQNRVFYQVLQAVEKEIELEAKRKKFSNLKKLASKSAGISPIPEKSWALRNVAGTLALKSSRGQVLQAKAMYEESVRLKEDYFASDSHPGLLEDLLPLARMLSSRNLVSESVVHWEKVCEIVGDIVDIMDCEGSYDEFCSEITMSVTMALREALGPSNDLTLRWKNRGMSYFDLLSEKQQEAVLERLPQEDVIQELASVFSCDIESRQNTGGEKTTQVGTAALKALECYEIPM